MVNFTLTKNDANMRVDKLIKKLMPTLPSSLMYKAFRKKDVKINGKWVPQEYKAKEKEIRNVLAEMPSGNEINQMLESAGLNMAEFYKLYSAKKIQDAIGYAKELKDRYTVLWMYYDMFGGEKMNPDKI